MKFEKFLISDTSGKKSLTATAFLLGFVVVNAKLLLSGMTFGDFTLSVFSGIEYAASLGALGGVYIMRRSKNKEEK